MIPPLRLLGIFVASFDIERVVRRPFLIRARGEHGDDGETNGLDGKGGRPIIRQNGKADVTVAIDVGMDGHVWPEEDDDRRIERVAFGKFEGKLKKFAIVKSRCGAFEIDGPFRQIAARLIRIDGNTRRWIGAQV